MRRLLNQVHDLFFCKSVARRRHSQRPLSRIVRIETLEERCLLAAGAPVPLVEAVPAEPAQEYLLVTDYDHGSVLRYDAATGAFVDEFVARNSGGLNQPQFLVFGPHDDNLYVGSSHFSGPGRFIGVLRYDGTTGALIDEFAESGPPSENCQYASADPSGHCGLLTSVHGVIFGPDGNLYVGDWSGGEPDDEFLGVDTILRFDGITGEFIDEFVTTNSGGLKHPFGMVFGPAGKNGKKLDLYVVDLADNNVLRYDGKTGDFKEIFVTSGSGGLDGPFNPIFGPDGDLYVGDESGVLRYQGPSGPTPGAFIDVFIPPDSGGLLTASGILFGPDGNGDAHQDLYVANFDFTGVGGDRARNGNVKRYDGHTGAFIDTFVPIGSGGLDNAWNLTFTHTDPVTMAYTGALAANSTKTSSALPASPVSESAPGSETITSVFLVGLAAPTPDPEYIDHASFIPAMHDSVGDVTPVGTVNETIHTKVLIDPDKSGLGIRDDETDPDFDQWLPTPLWEGSVDGIFAELGAGQLEAVLEL